MKRRTRFSRTAAWPLIPLIWFALPALAAPGAKVNVCHIPPGNPANFHTITIGEKALAAHLAHGDLAGACDDFCETLCDDGDACTVDACADGGGCVHPAVDCDDGNACTEDELCDPQSGCLNEPLPEIPCDDGNACTVADSCDGAGACVGDSVEGCCLEDADCDDARLCTDDACVIAPGDAAGTCVNEEVICETADLCATAACDELTGECAPADITCTPLDQCHDAGICDADSGACSNPAKADGTPCDDGDPDTENEECQGGVCTAPAEAGGCPCEAQPGWLPKVQFLTASAGCINSFFPQTFLLLGSSGEGAALALYDFGDTICEWQDSGSPLNSLVVESSFAEFEACRAVMTCLN
jgi:hypothetical protein